MFGDIGQVHQVIRFHVAMVTDLLARLNLVAVRFVLALAARQTSFFGFVRVVIKSISAEVILAHPMLHALLHLLRTSHRLLDRNALLAALA